jgi:putative tryptophan/tyrosine transport system substrate-binding protein
MRRREFIAALGGAVAWPLATHGQQPAMPVIGFLYNGPPGTFARLDSFRQGLRESGYFEGQNAAVEYRWADDQPDRLPELAADLVRRHVAVIAAVGGTNSVLAAKASTSTVPIVFLTGGDPVKLGLVRSLNRPEANVTGITFIVEELGAKELELLHELIPSANSVGMLVNPENRAAPQQIANAHKAARALGLDLLPVNVTNANDLNEAFDAATYHQTGALLVTADPFFGSHINQVVALATGHRIPTIYYRREFADAGGLASYGTSAADAARQVGIYTARILNGAKPGDLPVMQSTKFELVINLKTAKAIGLTVPPRCSPAPTR